MHYLIPLALVAWAAAEVAGALIRAPELPWHD